MNATTEFAATIGLNWADQKHDLWIRPADGSKAEHIRLGQTPEALHQWVAKLRERWVNRPVAIGIETSRGPVISAPLAYDFMVLFPVNPKALKDYRAAFSVSGAKDDRTDAQRLEEFVRLHRQKLKALDVTLAEDHSRVRHPNAALVLSMFRRVVVSFAQAWLEELRKIKPRTRASTRNFQKQFHHRDGGPERLQALIFAKPPVSWRLQT